MKKSIEISPNIETLFGTRDENLHVLEDGLNINIDLRSDAIELEGAARDVARAEQVFADYRIPAALRLHLQQWRPEQHAARADGRSQVDTARAWPRRGASARFGRRTVQPKSSNQRRYLEAIEKHDMVFGIGPAGTGKTYLAVAMAISASAGQAGEPHHPGASRGGSGRATGLPARDIAGQDRSLLASAVRRAVRHARSEKVDRYLEKNVIEIAPIAFMRGRTLNDSFVILDEAQNTTSEQMKMFVTRLGFNSKAVITGDITQIDLPNARRSGLLEAMDVLKSVEGLAFATSTKPTWCGITWSSALSEPTTSTRHERRATAASACRAPARRRRERGKAGKPQRSSEAAIREPKASSAEAKG